MRVYVICDSKSRIVGTAPSGVHEVRTSRPGAPLSKRKPVEEVFQVEVVPEPLPGQKVYELELPPELEAIKDGVEFLEVVSKYRVVKGAKTKAKLVRR